MPTPEHIKNDPFFRMFSDMLFEKIVQEGSKKKKRGRKKGSKNKKQRAPKEFVKQAAG